MTIFRVPRVGLNLPETVVYRKLVLLGREGEYILDIVTHNLTADFISFI